MKTILIVDDSETVLMMHQMLMADATRYRLLLGHDGEEAIELAVRHRPDLILMDVQMPVMDGFEAVRRIREYAALKATPIIMVTTLDQALSALEGYAAGCTDYIVKPFDRTVLAEKLDRHLNVSTAVKPGEQ